MTNAMIFSLIGFLGLAVALLALASKLWIPYILRTLADDKVFVVKVEENTAKAIETYGAAPRMVMSKKGFRFDKDWNIVDENSPDALPEHWIDQLLPGGLRWIGWPFKTKVKEYHFQWTTLRQGKVGSAGEVTPHGLQSVVQQENLEDLLLARDEYLDYIILKDDMYCIAFQNMEEQDKFPVSFIALMTARVMNPFKALYETEQWLEQIINFLRSPVKDYVGNKTFAELVTASKKATDESGDILGGPSPKPNVNIGDYILDRWGVKIEHLNLVNFRPAGYMRDAYEEAAATNYLKTQEAQGIRRVAEAERDRLTTVGEALTNENIMTLRITEAFEKVGESGNTIVIGGAQPINMLLDAARNKRPLLAGKLEPTEKGAEE